MERLAREATQAQELLTIKFQEELAIALRSVARPTLPYPYGTLTCPSCRYLCIGKGIHPQNGHTSTTTTTTVSTAVSSTQRSDINVSNYEFTWAQFVFPSNNKGQHHLKQ
ncbi:hypothetical protein BGZ95_006550, partial [Linnemannia exigua]